MDELNKDYLRMMTNILEQDLMDQIINDDDIIANEVKKWNERLAQQKRKNKINKILKNIEDKNKR